MAANGAGGEQGIVQANAQSTQTTTMGKAVTLADASCDQIKAEVATFDADKIPQKLADFGKANYHPTAEESIRFARYVDVTKASKDKGCGPAAMKKKASTTTASKAPIDPASKKKMATAGATTAKVKVMAPATASAKAAPMPEAQPVDEGVTVQVPDSSG